MNNYKLIFLLLFISLNVFCIEYADITLKNKEHYSGEVIEYYHDRWFYEADGPHIEKYILLFENKNGDIHFHFKNMNEVEDIRTTKKDNSDYSEYLKEIGVSLDQGLVHNQHVLTGNEGHHKFEKMFGNFAWDVGIVDKNKSQFKNSGINLQDYYIFGRDIISPVKGVVIGKVDGQEDNIPDLTFTSDLSAKINNYLTIKVNELIYLSVVHFKKGSISVNIGDIVEEGTFLGEVGNSGVSYVPHLHYTLYTYIKEYDRFISVPGVPF